MLHGCAFIQGLQLAVPWLRFICMSLLFADAQAASSRPSISGLTVPNMMMRLEVSFAVRHVPQDVGDYGS